MRRDPSAEVPVYDPLSCLFAFLFPDKYRRARDGALDGLWNAVIPVLVLGMVGVALWLALARS